MPTKRPRKASNSTKTHSKKRARTSDVTPPSPKPPRNPFIPEGMTKPVYLYFIDHLQATQQQAILANVARLNKMSHKIATPKLFHHVCLPSTSSTTRFFDYFNLSRPKGSIQDLSASDPLLLGMIRQTLLRKTFLPGLIRHLDITLDVDQLGSRTQITHYERSTKYIFPKLETLHITTYGNVLNDYVKREKGKAAQYGPIFNFIKRILNVSSPQHVRWVPLNGQYKPKRPAQDPLKISPHQRHRMRRYTWYSHLERGNFRSCDLPWLDDRFVTADSYRTVIKAAQSPIDHSKTVAKVLDVIQDLRESDYAEEALDGPSFHIADVPQAEKDNLERALREAVAEKMAFRYVISEVVPYRYSSADGWRRWIRQDVWGETLVYPTQGQTA